MTWFRIAPGLTTAASSNDGRRSPIRTRSRRPGKPAAEFQGAPRQKPEGQRKQDLAEMEPGRRGYIEVEIGVVDVMEAPEQRDAVHRAMPPVIRPVHQQKRSDRRDERRQLDPVEQSNPVLLRPEGVRQWNRHQRQPQKHERRHRHYEISHQPPQDRKVPPGAADISIAETAAARKTCRKSGSRCNRGAE